MPNTGDRTAFLRALLLPDAYPHPVGTILHIETHISDVLLTGEYAYKLKKPLDLGFLDFSTLERRRLCCEEELRLNRRLAPELYLSVMAITGSCAKPHIGGDGPIVDYAVCMRQFDQGGMLDRIALRGGLTTSMIDAIADQISEFHATLAPAPTESGYGYAGEITAPALQNFEQLLPLVGSDAQRIALESLRQWTEAQHRKLSPRFDARRREGFVRECHGDLHLGNMAVLDGRVRIFDCIEFNPHLRWIDVINEAAFLTMDLEQRGHADLAFRFINRYLERTGDYAGVHLLGYYMVYRALVRAKVAAMRAGQSDNADTRARLQDKCDGYLRLAGRLAGTRRRALLLMHGLSGSGKTVVSQRALETIGVIRVRSDIERKRLHGIAAGARTGSRLGEGIYDTSAGEATYARLRVLAEDILEAGFPVLVDATFLKRDQRRQFQAIAARFGVRFAILDIQASEPTLRRRIAARAAEGADASEANQAVLERQLASREALTEAERAFTYSFDSERLTPEAIAHRIGVIAGEIGS